MLGQHHRLIWWMIDAGAMQGKLPRGWVGECGAQMGCTGKTMNGRLKRLVEVGCLERRGQGDYRIRAEFFASQVPAK